MNDNINEKESQTNSDNRHEENKKNLNHNNKLNKITIPNPKKVMFENNKTQSKENLGKIINVNIP